MKNPTPRLINSIRNLIIKTGGILSAFFSHKSARFPSNKTMYGVIENINKSGAGLISRSKKSENNFTRLGSGLFSFHKNISDLLCLINEAAEQIGKEDGNGGINSAGEIADKALKDLDVYRNLVLEKSADMAAISGNLNKLFRLCDSFENAAGFFRSVGLNIKIESRRSEAANEMFGFISEEMRPLSEKIIEIISAIREDTENARKAQQTAAKSIESGLAEFGEMAEDASSTVKKAVNDIENLMVLSRNIMEKATSNSGKISRQTGEIVMQMQFHDSMRQRIEHMSSSLNEAESRVREAISAKTGSETKNERIGTAYAIINLQHAQLAAMSEEVEEVFHKCGNAFAEIKSNIDNLINNLRTEEDAGSKERDPFQRLKQSFSELALLMKRSRAITDILNEVTGKAGSTASRLSEYMKTVDRVNTDTHLIALNAIIKAAHLGAEGRTLEELAQILVGLSNQINEIVSEVNVIISDTNKQIEKLNSMNLKDDESYAYLEKTTRMLADTYDLFELKKSAARIKASELSSAISETVKNLDFIKILAKDFGKIKSGIENDLVALEPWTQNQVSYMAESADSLAETYTMQQQREVHEKMLASKTEAIMADEAPVELWDNIELFEQTDSNDAEPVSENEKEILIKEIIDSKKAGESEKPGQKNKDDDFGNNVELF